MERMHYRSNVERPRNNGILVEPEERLQINVLVGRQPILDRHNRTIAYELLFRSGMENRFNGSDGSAATTSVITNAFLTIGCNRVLGKKRGFINFTRELLVEGKALLLPKDRVVIEILEDVESDAEVLESCRRLKEAGYHIALDDVITTTGLSPLLRYADYAKLDWLALGIQDRRELCSFFRRKGIQLLAEKVETKHDFDSALSNGCELFQGFHFARPEIISAREVPTSKLACLRLIGESQKPELSFDCLEAIVKMDIGLTQRLLCFANSALFSRRHHISTLSQAFVYVGEDNIRRWVSMAALPGMAGGKPAELVTISLIRARFCELVAENSWLRRRSQSCFLIGLLSLLDAMIGRPFEELMKELGLEPHVADAILGTSQADDSLRSILEMAIALERSDFETAGPLASAVGISPATAGELHIEAMTWADSLPR